MLAELPPPRMPLELLVGEDITVSAVETGD